MGLLKKFSCFLLLLILLNGWTLVSVRPAHAAPTPIEPIRADNFDRLEVIGEYAFTGEFVRYHRGIIDRTGQWVAVDQYNLTPDSLDHLTVILSSRTDFAAPQRSIPILEAVSRGIPSEYTIAGEVLLFMDTLNSRLVVYDITTGSRLGTLEGSAAFINYEYAVDGSQLVGFMENDEVLVWDLKTRTLLNRWPTPPALAHGTWIKAAGIVLTNHHDFKLYSLSLADGSLRNEGDNIYSTFFSTSRDESLFYLYGTDGSLRMVESAALDTLFDVNIGDAGFWVSTGPQGRYVVTEKDRAVLHVWNGRTGELLRSLDTHSGGGIDFNDAEDLLINFDLEHYTLYEMSPTGLVEMDFPAEIANSDGTFDRISLHYGDTLIASHHSQNFDSLTLTIWAVRA